MRLTSLFSKALLALTFACGLAATSQAQTQIGRPDSVQASAVGALPPSNCPNIQTQWYATGQVPSGYYKQGIAPFHCLPIPACTSNQTFDQGTAACGCPAGTIWDGAYSTCHAACAPGTAWNGSACVNSCAAGTAWNGSSCVSVCSAGSTWNGTTCVSSCMGGMTWNGSSCACPAGEVEAGGVCGSSPAFTGFGISPTTQYIGSNHTVTWGTTGSGTVNVSLLCSGANVSANSLTPAAGGTGALAAANPGQSDCVAQATNAWGTVQAAAPTINAQCPPGAAWNGTACSVLSVGTLMTNKSVALWARELRWAGPYTGLAVSTPAATHSATGFEVWGDASGLNFGSKGSSMRCTITAVGTPCRFSGYYPDTVASSMYNQFDAGITSSSMWPATKYGFEFVLEGLLNADGSITVWFFTSNQCIGVGGSACLGSPYANEAYAWRTTIPASVYTSMAPGTTARHNVMEHAGKRAQGPTYMLKW